MKNFIKENWFKLLVLIIIIVIVFYYGDKSGNIKINKEQIQSFDTNLNKLTYQLPTYSKICIPDSKYTCTNEGCIIGKPSVFVLYDKNLKKVYRCDKNPCDGYDVSEEISGEYINLNSTIPNGSIVKISNDGDYVETVSLGLDFISYRGKCTNK